MSILDIFLGLLLVWGLWRGLKNGLIIELAALVALIAGIYGAIHFSYITGNYLSGRLDLNAGAMKTLSFILTFIIIVVLVHLAGKLLTKLVNIVLLGLVNKLFGGLFGVLKVAVVLGALLIYFDKLNNNLNLLNEETKRESRLYLPLKDLGDLVFDSVLQSDVDSGPE